MAVEKEIIVAIEFGSSKIRGIAGCKNIDGSIQILDVEQMDARNWIRKGVVYNIDKTEMCLRNITEKLEAELDVHIARVYVGIGGKSLRTRKNTVSRQFATKTIISQELVDSLYRTNKNISYPGYEILDVIPQEFRVGIDMTTEPVGVLSNHIEGTYLNVIAKSEVKEYIVKSVEACGLEIAGFFIAPMALAESVLTETEKRSGCTLVDFGAETTTVAVYKNNLLRHLAVIPLGGNNITMDISSLQMEEEDAENLKVKYGSAFSEQSREELSKNLLINNGRTIEERTLVDIVEAREEEILGNVATQIRNSGFQDKLISGIVISGGAANLKNVDKAVANRIKTEKTRFARIVPLSLSAVRPEQLVKDGTLNTLLSLLNVGKMNCVEAKAVEGTVEQSAEESEEVRQEEVNDHVDTVTEPVQDKEDEAKVEEKEKEKKPKTPKIGAFKKWLQKMTDAITAEE